jgi:hypothetical protein
VAWLVLDGERRGTTLDVVRRHLATVLPAPMVPADLVVVEDIPTLPSGKTDRAALPEPPSSAPSGTPPRDDAERAVAQIYADVLDLDAPPDVHTGFADLGGHSLLLAALRTRLGERLGVGVPVAELLARPTVAEVAELVRARGSGGDDGGAARLVPLRRAGGRPVLLLPGAGGVALPFGPLAGALPADRAVWAWQAPELADPSGAAPDLAAAVVDVLARIDELGGSVDLVGWSYGGCSPRRWRWRPRRGGGRSGRWCCSTRGRGRRPAWVRAGPGPRRPCPTDTVPEAPLVRARPRRSSPTCSASVPSTTPTDSRPPSPPVPTSPRSTRRRCSPARSATSSTPAPTSRRTRRNRCTGLP